MGSFPKITDHKLTFLQKLIFSRLVVWKCTQAAKVFTFTVPKTRREGGKGGKVVPAPQLEVETEELNM